MSESSLAAIFAFGSAVSVGVFSLVVRRGQQHGNAMTGVFIGLIVTLPFMLVGAVVFWDPAWWNPWAVLLFVFSGALGPCLGRVLMYQGIHYLGVARAVPMMATAPLFTGILAVVFLGERPGPYIWAGTLLIAVGCAAIAMKRGGEAHWDRRYIWVPFAAVASFGVANIFRKAGIDIVPSPLFGITVSSLAGFLFLLPAARLLPAAHRPRLRWGKAWYFYGLCGTLNTLAFSLHFFAIRHGDLTIVTPLSSTSPFFALILSGLLMRDIEQVTGRIVAGTAFVVLGGALIAWRVL
ncbi:MAG: DMT family transporter [bacterium]